MGSFLDVTPYHWAFNDIEEMQDRKMDDGTPFFAGIPYNAFSSDPVDVTITASINGQTEYIIDKVIDPIGDNPLIVLVDGVEVGYEKCLPNNPEAGKTYIKLARGARVGGVINFLSAGIPSMLGNTLNQPVGMNSDPVYLPSAFLGNTNGAYIYDPNNSYTTETAICGGRQLRRVANTSDIQFDLDYTIMYNTIYTHYALNNSIIELTYLVNQSGIIRAQYEKPQVHSPSVKYTNRFFPNTCMTRAEACTVVNRLRIYMEMKYTDGEPWRSTKITSRFSDVDTSAWYWVNVRDLEEIKMPDGSYLLTGVGGGLLDPNGGLTRAQMVTFLNQCRKWFIYAFK